MAYLVLGKNLKLLWSIFFAVGQIFIVVKGLILTNNITIWSNCQVSFKNTSKRQLIPNGQIGTNMFKYNVQKWKHYEVSIYCTSQRYRRAESNRCKMQLQDPSEADIINALRSKTLTSQSDLRVCNLQSQSVL